MTRRPRVTAAAMLLVTFLVGGMAGMAIEEALGLDWFDFLDADEEMIDERILAGLNLTPDQAREVEVILGLQEEKLEEYWVSRLPDLRRIVAEADSSVRALLTPEQREIFERRVESRGTRVPGGPD